MNDYVLIAVFMVGVFTGAGILYFGYKLGFRASYEIRDCKEQEDVGKGLFPKREPAEFQLIGDE